MTAREGHGSSAVPTSTQAPRRAVLLVDLPEMRVHRPGDLIEMLLSALGIGMVLLLAVYAHGTALGVTEDVQSAAAVLLRQVLLLPVTILEGVVTFFLPLVVIALQLRRWRWRVVLEGLAAAVTAGLLAMGAMWLLDTFATRELSAGLTITVDGDSVIAMNPFATALAALLTVVGTRSQRPSVRWSWNLLWVVLGLTIIKGELTLPGAVVAILIGRVVGLGMRYAAGVLNERANGISLVQGLRRAGLDPARVVRADVPRGGVPQAWTVMTSAPIGHTERLQEPSVRPAAGATTAPSAATSAPAGASSPAAAADDDALVRAAAGARSAARHDPRVDVIAPGIAPLAPDAAPPTPDGAPAARPVPDSIVPDVLTDPDALVGDATPPAGVALDPVSAHRVYSVWDVEGRRWYVVVLDGDRQVVGYLSSLWAAMRVRGLDRRRAASLRDAADRATLLSYAAENAGVRTPPLEGIAAAEDSVLLVSEHVSGARRLDELAAEEVDDALLDELWTQLRTAHACGVAHRDLTADAVLVGADRSVWILRWENGEIASSDLSRRLDLAQMLALTAVRVGAERALASAARSLSPDQLASIAPLLQPVVLPARTRASAKNHRELLNSLRAELVGRVPAADVEPVRLARFSVRTVVMVTLAIVAIWVLLGTLNFEQVIAATENANPAWLAASFGFGLLTYVGAALGLVAFAPERLGLWRTTCVQVAASVISLVAPAGVGPAALNLRFLNKRRIETPLAVATVALVQLSQFVTTILLLVAVALLTGSAGTLSLPSGAVAAAVVAALAIAGVAALVPPLRTWVWAKAAPTLRQVWPRLLWVVGSPGRLLAGIGGNILMTAGYVASFGAALAAFGYTLPLTSLSITYLTSNAVGAAVPSPGGIGPVEAALTAGLSVAGIPAGVAFSAALVFRVLTFWARVPLGWAALRFLQRRGDL
ncbi:lysylphosphatidylglycerol synthase transmembrane domain-containing protein [Georgenia sp. MJ206]|uniref:lysylphosphatidylglycerol synthase transmembrane domain-containing protein n=1 Tax=Georgenia wangjunii TaxID=3117730 RepID=UPI002F267EED